MCNSVRLSQASSTRVGIGAYFQRSETVPDTLEVKRILPNSPAAACKRVSVGDAIVAVDGELVSGKSLSQLAEKVRLRESESARERARARAGARARARARERVGKGERSRERVWSDVAIFGVYAAGAGYDEFHGGVLVSEQGNLGTLQRDSSPWCQQLIVTK